MLPTNKDIAVLHPYVNKVWWAVNMMLYLSKILNKDNQVTFFTFYYDKSKNFDYIWDFKIKSYNSLIFLKLFIFLLIAFHIRKKDYIIVWNSPMHFVGVLSKIVFFSKAKIIWWNHHYPWYYWNKTTFFIFLKRFIEKLILKKVDIIVANSIFLREAIKKIYKRDSFLLYPILDKYFENSYKKQNNNDFILFTYSRWVKWKNINLIFQLYEKLRQKHKNLKIYIWWVGEELSLFKDKYKKEKNITFLWFLDKKQILLNLRKSSIFLFPSTIDSFWMVVLEAISQWLPVICFRKSWINELVINNQNWFLVDSFKEFTKKTDVLINDSLLRNKFSIVSLEKSKSFSESNFLISVSKLF